MVTTVGLCIPGGICIDAIGWVVALEAIGLAPLAAKGAVVGAETALAVVDGVGRNVEHDTPIHDSATASRVVRLKCFDMLISLVRRLVQRIMQDKAPSFK